MKLISILVTLLVTFQVTHARDPDSPPPDYYGEHTIVGGSKWDGGDTFIAIVLPLTVAAMIALPHIFDGKNQEWPVYKFRLHLLLNVNKTVNSLLHNNIGNVSVRGNETDFVGKSLHKFALPKLGTNVPKMGTIKFPTRRISRTQ